MPHDILKRIERNRVYEQQCHFQQSGRLSRSDCRDHRKQRPCPYQRHRRTAAGEDAVGNECASGAFGARTDQLSIAQSGRIDQPGSGNGRGDPSSAYGFEGLLFRPPETRFKEGRRDGMPDRACDRRNRAFAHRPSGRSDRRTRGLRTAARISRDNHAETQRRGRRR